jgi:hypothetical protein
MDCLRTGRSGDRIPVGARFSAAVQTGPEAQTASCTMGTGSFPGAICGRGVTLTPRTLLVPGSRKSRSIPLLSLRAFVAYERVKSIYDRSQWWIVVKNVQPSSKAVQPSGKAVQPSSKAVQPSGKAVQPSGKAVQPSGKAGQPSGSKRREEIFYLLSNCYILFLLSLECLTISTRR